MLMRYRLARVLDASGAIEATLRAPTWTGPRWIRVLTYHRIHPDADSQAFDQGVIDATPEEFDRQLETVHRYLTPIGLRELVDFRKRNRPLPERPVIVTFDDGYRECRDIALPLLLKHGVKASFFIATRYLSERRVFWWDRLSYTVRSSTRDRIDLEYPTSIALDLADREQALRRLLRIVKTYDSLDLERFLSHVSDAACVPWDRQRERELADELVMTWDDVRALAAEGMEIHSHTRTHRVLQTLPPADLEPELVGSREDLRDQLGDSVSCVSYPVGRSIAGFPLIREAVVSAGYDLGLANGSGVTWCDQRFDPFDVGRIEMERGMPHSFFRAMIAHPSFTRGMH